MKKIVLMFALLLSQSTFAYNSDTLMVVRKSSGFVPQQYSYSIECEIGDRNTIVKIKKAGVEANPDLIETQYTESVHKGDVVRGLLKVAAQSDLESRRTGDTCSNTSSFEGVLYGDVVTQVITLARSGYIDVQNRAAGIESLIEFGNKNCPTPLFE